MKKYIAILMALCLLMQCLPLQAMAQVVGSTVNALYTTQALESRYLGGMTLSLIRSGAGIDTDTFLRDGQTPSISMDALQLGAWLWNFLDEDVQAAMDLSVSVQESVGQLRDSGVAAHSAAVDTLDLGAYDSATLTLSQVQAQVHGYASALESARQTIHVCSDTAQDPKASLSDRKEAFRRIRAAYDSIRQIRSEVCTAYAGWISVIAGVRTSLDGVSDSVNHLGADAAQGMDSGTMQSDAYVSVVRSALQSDLHSRLGHGLQAPGVTKTQQDFTVLILHDDEIAFMVYDGTGEKSKLLGGAKVEIWTETESKDHVFTVDDDSKASATTTDTDKNRGAARFAIKKLNPNEENKFVLCYRVSKAGYETYSARLLDSEGGSKIEVHLKAQTDTTKAYISTITFNGNDCYRGSAGIDCNRLDESKRNGSLYFRAPAGSGTAKLTVSYVQRELTKDASGKKVEKHSTKDFTLSYTSTGFGQEQCIDFSDQWAKMLRYKTDVSLKLTLSHGGRTYDIEPQTSITLNIAAVTKPTNLTYGLDSITGKFLNFNFPVGNALGTSFDIGVDNPLANFRLTIMASTKGSWFFGVGYGGTRITDCFSDERDSIKMKQSPTKKDVQSWANLLKNTKQELRSKMADEQQKRKDGKHALGTTVSIAFGLAGTGTMVPNPVSGYYCDMGFEIMVSLTGSLEYSCMFTPGGIPLLIRITASMTVGVALRFGWLFPANVDPEDANAEDDAILKMFEKFGLDTSNPSKSHPDVSVVITLGASVTVFGGLGINHFAEFGLEATIAASVSMQTFTFCEKDFWGGKLTSALVSFSLGVSFKLILLNFKFTILKTTLAEYHGPDPKGTALAKADDPTPADDVSPAGEKADGNLMAQNVNRLTTMEPGSGGLRVVDSGKHIYGFYLGANGTVQSILLDEGLEGSAVSMGAAADDDAAVYDFSAAALPDDNLIMITELLRTGTRTRTGTLHLQDADDITYTYQVPQQKSMLMRITFYSSADEGGALTSIRQDEIRLAHAMSYYSAISCSLGVSKADGTRKVGITYWEAEQRKASCYHLSFKRSGSSITWVQGPTADEQAVSDVPYKEIWWFGSEMTEAIWASENAQLLQLRSVFSDGENLTVYALLGIDTSKVTISGIDGDITVLLARTWDSSRKGTTSLVAATALPMSATLSWGGKTLRGTNLTSFNYTDAMLETPYGIKGFEVMSDDDGKDLLMLHVQVKDEDNSTDDRTVLCNALMGVHLEIGSGKAAYKGYKLYDVPGMGQNATVTQGFGSWAIYWIESVQPTPGATSSGTESDPPYFRMRAALHDEQQDMMTKAYTLATFDPETFSPDQPVQNIHVYHVGTTTMVVVQQTNESNEAAVDILNFKFTETPSLSFDRFELQTPAVKPGENVSIWYTVYNDGNVPLTGYHLSIMDGGKERAQADYSFVKAQGTLTLTADALESGSDALTLTVEGDAGIHTYGGMFDRRHVWETETGTADGRIVAESVSQRYLMPGESQSFGMTFEAARDEGGQKAQDMNLTATITQLKTQAVLMTGADGSATLSAMNAWGYGLRNADNGTLLTKAPAALFEITMDLNGSTRKDISAKDQKHAEYTVRTLSGDVLLMDDAGHQALSRFTSGTTPATADTGYGAADLSIMARTYLTSDGTRMVSISLSNNAMAPAEDPVIRAYAGDMTTPTYVIELSDGTLSLNHRWTVTAQVPLDTLTGGQNVDAVILEASSKTEEAADLDNKTTVLLHEAFCILLQPEDDTCTRGEDAIFRVKVRGGQKPWRWQWQKQISAAKGWVNIDGATEAQLRLEHVGPGENGTRVRCVITDASGKRLVSDTAELTVINPIPPTGDNCLPLLWPALSLGVLGLYLFLRRRKEHA